MGMLVQALLGLLCWLGCGQSYEVVLALNCGGSTDIKTELLEYVKDKYYSPASKANHKSYLSRSIRDPQERSLLKSERTSSETFSYEIPLKAPGAYGVAVKFIEQTHSEVGVRVFNVKLGDDVVLNVDIFKNAGAKRPLTKYFDFELDSEVLFLNKTDPVLNGYDFLNKNIVLTFQKVKGDPKVQAIILVKGNFVQFRKDYQQRQYGRQTGHAQYICEKIYNIPPKSKNVLERGQTVTIKQFSSLQYYAGKLFSFRGLLSLCIFILMKYQNELVNYLNELLKRLKHKPQSKKQKKQKTH